MYITFFSQSSKTALKMYHIEDEFGRIFAFTKRLLSLSILLKNAFEQVCNNDQKLITPQLSHRHLSLLICQDRRRRLEDLWFQRRVKLEQHLQLLLLDQEVKKVSDWYSQVGDQYLANKELGDSVVASQQLQEQHIQFEYQARVS